MDNQSYADLMGKDIEESLRRILNSVMHSGSQDLYPGIVEDNKDPDQTGRCRIRVVSKFGTDIATKDLPWAVPDNTHTGSLLGSFVVPPIGAIVNVYFKDGVLYAPHYTSKVFNKKNLPSNRTEDYPDNVVFWESDNGGYLAYNRKKGRIEFYHEAGVLITFDENGNIQIDNSSSKGNITLICAGEVTIEAGTLIVKNDTGSVVTPNPAPMGGPFCALPACLLTGAPHQGKIVKNCFVKDNDI